jgi:predicted helicase
MSIQAINQYHNAIHKNYKFSEQNHEQAIKSEFAKLINHYCEKRNLLLVIENSLKTKRDKTIRPDGIIKRNRVIIQGYWESKANVDLEKEIVKKINSGYPLSNILFQDEKTAILYQNGQRILKSELTNEQELHNLLEQFVDYDNGQKKEFDDAIESFKKDLPEVLKTLRDTISKEEQNNHDFIEKRQDFLAICQHSINPAITVNNVNEMLLQHILTEDIFTSIFNNSQFHRENNIARELYAVESTFFKGAVSRDALTKIEPYYKVIKKNALLIDDSRDKQTFLKTVYEDFYKIYNPKAADKLGIVYTPNEIVKFQIESVDYLLEKYFKKSLSSKSVKILDPCTGTGTYICELIEYLSPLHLEDKYRNDIYVNELELLPYYIANLNIEYTYQQKMGGYVEFDNICWVDTLDNTGTLKETNADLFGLSIENTKRIKEQNKIGDISVIIGNPPYNANQQNENDNNKNREYKEIDSRIKATYIKESNAQKTKLYDMYSRFYRWASDRINEEQGIIAFVTNNSFINSKTFDGFRKCISKDFDFAYIIDTRSDVRANPKIAGTTHNVFGIQTGVAIMFLVKENNNTNKSCKIFYTHLADEILKGDKLNWLENNRLEKIDFEKIIPDKNNNWLNQSDNDFDSLMPISDKENNAIFRFSSLGVSTNRDDWVYDFSEKNLKQKIRFFIKYYNELLKNNDGTWNESIKWSRDLKRKFQQKKKLAFNAKLVNKSNYRPYVKKYWYAEKLLNDILTQNHYDIFGKELNKDNNVICFSGQSSSKPFQVLSVNNLSGLDFLEKTQCVPLYVYDTEGEQHDNITNWALSQFKNNYPTIESLNKLDIFHYVYAVLHNPAYREKYEQNLKREFPRILFYENFSQWVDYGRQLMELHLDYETAEHYPLKRQNLKVSKIPKAKLKADKEQGLIFLDDNTTLSEIPAAAWDYKLGNRSALEWILDQYKEKNPKDATIAEQFNTYRFADYKEQVIELLSRVCTVSVETVKIVNALPALNEKLTK